MVTQAQVNWNRINAATKCSFTPLIWYTCAIANCIWLLHPTLSGGQVGPDSLQFVLVVSCLYTLQLAHLLMCTQMKWAHNYCDLHCVVVQYTYYMVCSSTGTSAESSRLAGWRGTAETIQTGNCCQDGTHETLSLSQASMRQQRVLVHHCCTVFCMMTSIATAYLCSPQPRTPCTYTVCTTIPLPCI